MTARRVAVTGIGVVSPLGLDAVETWAGAVAGRSAVRRLDAPAAARLAAPMAVAAVPGFDGAAHFDAPKLRMIDRATQLALVAAAQAAADAGDGWAGADRGRAGVFVGTGMGASHTLDDGYRTLYGEASDRIRPFTVLAGMHNAPASWIGLDFDLRGPNLTYSTACSSSAVSIGEAFRRVRDGDCDAAIAGGTEAPLSPGSLKAWEALRVLAAVDPDDPAASCRPFSADRSGMVLGEGAAMVVLESWESAVARGARVRGEVIGYGLATDTAHITRPSVEGQAAALRAALASASLDPSQVDAINAHGTGTQANDGVETAAVRAVFGAHAPRVPLSSTKAMHGHLLGAAGALELVLSLLAMRESVVLPTINLRRPDPACDLDHVPHAARHGVEVRTMLTSSFAFGGTNAVLALRRAG